MGITAAFMVPHPPLIVPEIGQGKENGILQTINAYQQVAKQIGAYKPETILLISPHQILYSDYFHISPGTGAKGDFSRFGAGQVEMRVYYDTKLVGELCRIIQERKLPAGTMGERDSRLDHGTMVPLYFVNQYITDYRLVRIGLSGLPLAVHYELGQCIREAVEKLGRNAVIIASGDLSHRLKESGPYGFHKNGPEYDRRIMDAMGGAVFGELLEFSEEFLDGAGECGHRSFTIMSGALDETAVQARRLSYEGPYGVGYGICTYEVKGRDAERNFKAQYEKMQVERFVEHRAKEDAYVRLARRTIEEYVRKGKKPEMPDGILPEMKELRAGVFVSIKKQGRLRGCIGTIEAVCDSIVEEIMENAVKAAAKDPRFAPIKTEELDWLTISVDVLGGTERIDSLAELDVKKYGVIVTKGYKRGLLLPNLEGVDTVEEQIAIAKQKAGIDEEEEVELRRFEVVRHY